MSEVWTWERGWDQEIKPKVSKRKVDDDDEVGRDTKGFCLVLPPRRKTALVIAS